MLSDAGVERQLRGEDNISGPEDDRNKSRPCRFRTPLPLLHPPDKDGGLTIGRPTAGDQKDGVGVLGGKRECKRESC